MSEITSDEFLSLCNEPGALSRKLSPGDKIKVPTLICSEVSNILWESGIDYFILRSMSLPGWTIYEITDPRPPLSENWE